VRREGDLVSIQRVGEAVDDLSVARAQAVEVLLPCLERESERVGDRCLLICDTAGNEDRALVGAVREHHRRELLPDLLLGSSRLRA